MKITPPKGLFQPAVAAMIIVISLLFARSFPSLAVYALFGTIWLLFCLIRCFFDTD